MNDFSMLTKFIPELESIDCFKKDDKYYELVYAINFASDECLKQYPDFDRGPKTNDFLVEAYTKTNHDDKDYFSFDVSLADEKIIVGLINMMYALSRWSGNLIDTMFEQGYVLAWLKRLDELQKGDK